MADRRRPTSYAGVVAIVGSAVLFAVATVLVKMLAQNGISPGVTAFGRFSIGALVLGLWLGIGRRRFRPRRWQTVLARAALNVAAVLLFYKAIEMTTVTKANILNMTYPLFVGLLGPVLVREQTGVHQVVALVIGFVGTLLVVMPFGSEFATGDLVGLACGIVSAFAVLALREARAWDEADVIVFWVMLLGCALLLPWVPELATFVGADWGLWFGAAVCGVGGQLLITFGYRYATAVDGSVASLSRILFAGGMGALIFGDVISLSMVIGSALIVVSIVAISRRNSGSGTIL